MELFQRLGQSIGDYIEKYRIRQKHKKVHDTDISISDYAKYVVGKVERCVNESIQSQGELLQQSVRMLSYARNIVSIPLSISGLSPEEANEILSRFAGPWTRVHESFNLLDDSLLLALAGRYTVAYGSLRSAIECIIMGSFYNGVIDSKLRFDARLILNNEPRNYPKSIAKFIEDVLRGIPDDGLKYFVFEYAFEKALREHSPPLRPPGVSSMLRAITLFYPFEELDDAFEYIYNQLYGSLSVYTHMMVEATTSWQYAYDDRIEFDSGRVSEKMIQDFVPWFWKTLDVIGVIYLHSVREMFQIPKARSASVMTESRISKYGSQLPFTRQVLYTNLGLGR